MSKLVAIVWRDAVTGTGNRVRLEDIPECNLVKMLFTVGLSMKIISVLFSATHFVALVNLIISSLQRTTLSKG